jgi:tetratricopeptide (TPR) repeat protein
MMLTQEQVQGFASLGYNLYEQGKFDDAQKVFEGLTAVDPNSSYGFAGLGAIALAKDPPDLDTAIANLSKAAEVDPNNPTVHANLGEAYLRKAQLQEAAAEFHKAMELDPEKKDAGANRARAIISGLKVATEEYKKKAS